MTEYLPAYTRSGIHSTTSLGVWTPVSQQEKGVSVLPTSQKTPFVLNLGSLEPQLRSDAWTTFHPRSVPDIHGNSGSKHSAGVMPWALYISSEPGTPYQ